MNARLLFWCKDAGWAKGWYPRTRDIWYKFTQRTYANLDTVCAPTGGTNAHGRRATRKATGPLSRPNGAEGAAVRINAWRNAWGTLCLSWYRNRIYNVRMHAPNPIRQPHLVPYTPLLRKAQASRVNGSMVVWTDKFSSLRRNRVVYDENTIQPRLYPARSSHSRPIMCHLLSRNAQRHATGRNSTHKLNPQKSRSLLWPSFFHHTESVEAVLQLTHSSFTFHFALLNR